ncbi:hypothetical protein AJ87_09085 [Rhizobium yanglingense]|nr:hypothetical protein AJ87_09085 [Rhizobium yanglingense]
MRGQDGGDDDPANGVFLFEPSAVLSAGLASLQRLSVYLLPGVGIGVPERFIGVTFFEVGEELGKGDRHGRPGTILFVVAIACPQ